MVDCDTFCYCTNVLFDTQLFHCYKLYISIYCYFVLTDIVTTCIHINLYIIYLP